MAQKCVHKGCGKVFTDSEDPCTYHPGPPVFHEGQKGWKCCKPRVLTFDEFLSIPPCTTGKHSTVDDTPAEPSKSEDKRQPEVEESVPSNGDAGTGASLQAALPSRPAVASNPPAAAPPAAETDSDSPELSIPVGKTCRRRGCNSEYKGGDREAEECVYHPGAAIFHEGSKGWSCCKRRVLEFEEFMRIEGCQKKARHLFIGNGKKKGGADGGKNAEEKVETVRHDFYQTPSLVIASLYLKKIDSPAAKITFSSSQTIDLDLPTSDHKRYTTTLPLFAPIDPEKSNYKIMGTKLELTLAKADGTSWPVFRSDERWTGERIQVGKAGRV